MPPMSSRLYRFLGSKQLALGLFLVFCLSLIPGTLEKENFHLSGISRIIIGCMGLNLILCTAQRLRSLPQPVLVIHVGTVLILAGGLASSLGFVATVNIYEGSSVDVVYRWDIDQDVPLGATLTVKRVNSEYYPVPVKVGVLRGGEKAGLFQLKTGENFLLDGYTVRATAIEVLSENLKLSIYREGRLIGVADTDGASDLPQDFPYEFVLVAYRNPVYKMFAVDLELSQGEKVVAEGTTEVNSPLGWEGQYFYCTNLARDEYGKLYAGIQISRDPGRLVVYAGFFVIMAGMLIWSYRKFR